MKQLFILMYFLLILISCDKPLKNSNDNTDSNSQTITEKTIVGPLIKLQYKFKKGDKFSYKLQTLSNHTESISADTSFTNEIKQNATYKFNFVVKEVSSDHSAKIDVRINSIVAETNYNGQVVKYDSKYIYSSREMVQFVDYESVKKVPFSITVNKLGQVEKVDKINKIMRNILKIQNVPDTLSAKTKEKMKFNIANGTLMPLTQQVFKVVSENKVGIDSTWQLNYSTPLAVFKIENTAIFKIENINFVEDTTASISSNLYINVVGDNIVNEKGITYTFAQPKLEATGSVEFNNTKGLVNYSESNTKLEMTMYMEGIDSNKKPLKSSKKDITNNTNVVELL